MAIVLIAGGLMGCETGSSESLGRGIANYDALRTANAACEARGGKVVPLRGGDAAQLSDYSCVIPGSK